MPEPKVALFFSLKTAVAVLSIARDRNGKKYLNFSAENFGFCPFNSEGAGKPLGKRGTSTWKLRKTRNWQKC